MSYTPPEDYQDIPAPQKYGESRPPKSRPKRKTTKMTQDERAVYVATGRELADLSIDATGHVVDKDGKRVKSSGGVSLDYIKDLVIARREAKRKNVPVVAETGQVDLTQLRTDGKGNVFNIEGKPVDFGNDKLGAAIAEVLSRTGSTSGVENLFSDDEQQVRGRTIYIAPRAQPGKGKNVRSPLGEFGAVPKTETTGAELLDSLGKMSDGDFRALQEKLYLGGFYGLRDRDTVRWGVKTDADTRAAYAAALIENVTANATTKRGERITLEDMLDKYAAEGPAALRDGGGKPFVFQPRYDDDTVRRMFDDALPSVIGMTLSADELDALTAKWQQLEQASQRSVYDTATTGGTAQAAPNLEAFLRTEAERRRPNDYQAKQMADLSKQFLASIEGFVGQVQGF